MRSFLKTVIQRVPRGVLLAAFLLAVFFGLKSLLGGRDLIVGTAQETIEQSGGASVTNEAANTGPALNLALPAQDQINTPKKSSLPILALGDANTVTFREVFTEESVALLQQKIFQMIQNLPSGSTIYLVLDTPGGSIDAGQDLIAFINALPYNVKTVTLFAASMGFQTVQGVKGQRIVGENGVLMSHRAKLGLQGEVPGEFLVRLNWIMRNLEKLEQITADRVGMKLADYQTLIRDEYWVQGDDGVSQHMADKVMSIRCQSDMSGTESVTVRTFFGNVDLKFSKCPLIRYPVEISFGNINMEALSVVQQAALRQFVYSYAYSKRKFVEDYIVTNKYIEFIK